MTTTTEARDEKEDKSKQEDLSEPLLQINIEPPSHPTTPDSCENPSEFPTTPLITETFAEPETVKSVEAAQLLDNQELIEDIEAAPLVELRKKTTKHERPKSLIANLNSLTKRKRKSITKRPKSLLVKSSVSEEDPILEEIDFDTLHKLKFKHKSETDVAKILSSVERRMIADICQSSQE